MIYLWHVRRSSSFVSLYLNGQVATELTISYSKLFRELGPQNATFPRFARTTIPYLASNFSCSPFVGACYASHILLLACPTPGRVEDPLDSARFLVCMPPPEAALPFCSNQASLQAVREPRKHGTYSTSTYFGISILDCKSVPHKDVAEDKRCSDDITVASLPTAPCSLR